MEWLNSHGNFRSLRSCQPGPYLVIQAKILDKWQSTYKLDIDVARTSLHKDYGKNCVAYGCAILRLKQEYCPSAGDVDEASVEADEAVSRFRSVANKSVCVFGYISLWLRPGDSKVIASDRVVEEGCIGDVDLF